MLGQVPGWPRVEVGGIAPIFPDMLVGDVGSLFDRLPI